MQCDRDEVPGFGGQQLNRARCVGAELEPWPGELRASSEIPQGRKEWTGGLPPHKQLWNEDEIQCLFFLPETIGNVALTYIA